MIPASYVEWLERITLTSFFKFTAASCSFPATAPLCCVITHMTLCICHCDCGNKWWRNKNSIA